MAKININNSDDLKRLVWQLREKLEYGEIYQWDDGDDCWDDMRRVASSYDQDRHEKT